MSLYDDLIKCHPNHGTNPPPEEVDLRPALKVAIEALDKLADSSYCTDVANEIRAREALAKINALTGE